MNIQEAYKLFPTQESCILHLERVRWGDRVICAYCSETKISPSPDKHRHHCNVCNASFSVTVNTIFQKTKIDLQKWFVAISIALEKRDQLRVRDISSAIEVNKNTAVYMASRLRRGLAEDR